jgi:Tol biopolymer transport system component
MLGWGLLCSVPPVWAAVVYSALEDGLWRVYYQERLDSIPIPLNVGEGELDASAPRLSPDGRSVALELTGEGIVVCSVAAPHVCSELGVPGEPAARPAWNALTGEVAFVRYSLARGEEDSEILTTRDGRSAVAPLLRMTGIQDYPDISADGRFLVFSSGKTISLYRAGVQVVQHLWVTDLVTGVTRQVSSSSVRDIHPRWSPDGQRIAFASDRTGRFEIWVVARDGIEARQLTYGEGAKSWPDWSLDGAEIMYARSVRGRRTLWIVDVATGETRQFQPPSLDSAVQLRDPDWR